MTVKGTLKYRKVERTPQVGKDAGKKKYYATAVQDRTMEFEDFVTHIAEHNSPYSRGTVHGVLMDTLDCLQELILDGKSVRFSDLGLFSLGMSSRGEETASKVTAQSIEGVHLILRNTKYNVIYFIVSIFLCIFAPRILKHIEYEGNRLYSCFNK